MSVLTSKVFLFDQPGGPSGRNETLFVADDGFYQDISGSVSRAALFDLYAKPEYKTPENRAMLAREDAAAGHATQLSSVSAFRGAVHAAAADQDQEAAVRAVFRPAPGLMARILGL